MEAKHTPTPWRIASKESDDVYAPIKIQFGNQVICALALDDAPVHDFNREQHLNAAHIVKCVNAHDELVATAKAFQKVATGEPKEYAEAYHRLSSALAKAEGM